MCSWKEGVSVYLKGLSQQLPPHFHFLHLQGSSKSPKPFEIMTTIFEAIAILRKVFDKYAGKEGDAKTLTKKELTQLIKEQLGGAPTNQAEMDNFFKTLDGDGDGVVDFNEYVILVASLAMMLAP